jgi:hypothetical protein
VNEPEGINPLFPPQFLGKSSRRRKVLCCFAGWIFLSRRRKSGTGGRAFMEG